jgi:hypothetical protein
MLTMRKFSKFPLRKKHLNKLAVGKLIAATYNQATEAYQAINPFMTDSGKDQQSLPAPKLTAAASVQTQLPPRKRILASLRLPCVLRCLGSWDTVYRR